jgi:hypothetical protein
LPHPVSAHIEAATQCAAAILESEFAAASRADLGHPEEILTRHQPISIPIGPRTGRESQ